jgi:SagB-type dehydrogenase family enzyme
LKLVRSPDILIAWRGGVSFVEHLPSGRAIRAESAVIRLLEFFGEPRSLRDARAALDDFTGNSVLEGARTLRRLGLLIPARAALTQQSLLERWGYNLASAYYHVACRDIRYTASRKTVDAFLLARVAAGDRPPSFKRYATAPALRLPPIAAEHPPGLARILGERRTVRVFRRNRVTLQSVGTLLKRTWGLSGWLDGGLMGRLPRKTSPSAGALHPIESYLIAWNVRGLAAGLYHYDVRGDELRRLRHGDFRRDAIEAAGGQRWIGQAAFLCVMTAVFGRTLWKYQLENAYRVIWMDAGHLGQTFCLVATALGLGPFTTAAIHSRPLERLLRIDGISEFPVYLCGAGVPADSVS